MPPEIPIRSLAEAVAATQELAARWDGSKLGERQSFQSWFLALCEALGVAAPGPEHGDGYCFEKPVDRPGESRDTTGFIDGWKAGHFAIEAKATGGGNNDLALRRAFNQVRAYVAAEPSTVPPFLMVVDVPHTLVIWNGFTSGGFGGYLSGHRINLASLHERPEDVALLRDIFTNPAARDPRGKAQRVTKEIAGKLAELSTALEGRGHEPERVARFLMRCVFCFFAEDVGLLPRDLFRRTLESSEAAGGPDRVAAVLTKLWQTMDTGGDFGADLIARFNGHFFATVEALPLEPSDVKLLVEAARLEWSAVEPSIFGTLLVRALEPSERHKLGAEYTPRAYIERLVEPTVIEPIRERWTAVQARVAQLEAEELAPKARTNWRANKTAKLSPPREEALQALRDFHGWLCGLRFLDPACGSGNFLYVTMAMVKRIESEVLTEMARVARGQEGLVLDEVHPRQFFGIEVNWWAREIAELTLWIGYYQFWREAHGGRTPPSPILVDTGTILYRDAILEWDEIVHRPEKDRPDPTPRIVHPVTGELVPDPEATLPYMEYVGARQAEWPAADFIVGNPPYLGQGRMREALGDGYVDALRGSYAELPPSIDLVMYWWHRGAQLVLRNLTTRVGLITTSSLTQTQNRRVISDAQVPAEILRWAVASHPWVDESGSASVTVAMTVLGRSNGRAVKVKVDDNGVIASTTEVERFNSDLTTHANVGLASSTPLLANEGLSHDGVKLHGTGFLLTPAEVAALSAREEPMRPYLNGRDLAARTRDLTVIDFGLMEEDEARAFPISFDLVRDRVLPHREGNRRSTYRDYWWRFGEPRRFLREALVGLEGFFATVDTARHRYFVEISVGTVIDDKLVAIAVDDPSTAGVLGSRIHCEWALAAGGRLGVGNDPVYTKTRCFDAFPFPDPSAALRETIGNLAEKLDQHRKDAIARDERVTMTGMYNVVEKLRSGEALTPKERAIHGVAACGILKDMHDELDALVAEAYGWPWPMEREEILERLVALHAERVAEEARGQIRWLRPEYQIPRFAPEGAIATVEPDDETTLAPATVARPAWPSGVVEQLAALAAMVAIRAYSVDEAVAAFVGADRAMVARHLETLAMMGEGLAGSTGPFGPAV
jgi:hypothetical protein